MQHGAQSQAASGGNLPAPLETRLADIERKLDELTAGSKKADAPVPPDKKRPGFWFDIVKSLIPSLVMLWATYAIKDSVDMALKERQLQLQNVQAMASLQNTLQNGTITPDEATKEAVELAGFGRYSIPFFVNVLEVGGQNGKVAAELGLRMVSRTEPEEVCTTMKRIITNHSGLYTWTTHFTALSLLGEAGCGSSYTTVSAYAKDLSSANVLQKWVASPSPDRREYDLVVKQAATTKSVLESVPRRHWWNHIGAGETR